MQSSQNLAVKKIRITKQMKQERENARLMAMEEANKKYQDDIQAGLESRRYGFPEYQWRMTEKGRNYLRSSCNWNVYSYSECSQIVGMWNDVEKRIDFVPDLLNKIEVLEHKLKLALAQKEKN